MREDHLTRGIAGRSSNAKSGDPSPNTRLRKDSLTSAIDDYLVAGRARGLSPRDEWSYTACCRFPQEGPRGEGPATSRKDDPERLVHRGVP